MSVVETLTAAKDYLMENGWTKYHSRHGQKACAAGAVTTVMGVFEQVENYEVDMKELTPIGFLEKAVNVVGPRYHGNAFHPVPAFNDAEETTFNDVMALFDEAILLAKEATA